MQNEQIYVVYTYIYRQLYIIHCINIINYIYLCNILLIIKTTYY